MHHLADEHPVSIGRVLGAPSAQGVPREPEPPSLSPSHVPRLRPQASEPTHARSVPGVPGSCPCCGALQPMDARTPGKRARGGNPGLGFRNVSRLRSAPPWGAALRVSAHQGRTIDHTARWWPGPGPGEPRKPPPYLLVLPQACSALGHVRGGLRYKKTLNCCEPSSLYKAWTPVSFPSLGPVPS